MEEHNSYSDVTPEIVRLAELSKEAGVIDTELYTKYDVKRGLRDLNGKGVLAGLTNISDVRATKMVDGKSVPCDGHLFTEAMRLTIWLKVFTRITGSVLKRLHICCFSTSCPPGKSLPNLKSCLFITEASPQAL